MTKTVQDKIDELERYGDYDPERIERLKTIAREKKREKLERLKHQEENANSALLKGRATQNRREIEDVPPTEAVTLEDLGADPVNESGSGEEQREKALLTDAEKAELSAQAQEEAEILVDHIAELREADLDNPLVEKSLETKVARLEQLGVTVPSKEGTIDAGVEIEDEVAELTPAEKKRELEEHIERLENMTNRQGAAQKALEQKREELEELEYA